MALRIEQPALDSTKELMVQILTPILREKARVIFLCKPGEGPAIVQRVRVMITRHRRHLESKGGKPKRFRLHSTIHPETHAGKRYDACVCWHTVSESHEAMEMLEDLLADGK